MSLQRLNPERGGGGGGIIWLYSGAVAMMRPGLLAELSEAFVCYAEGSEIDPGQGTNATKVQRSYNSNLYKLRYFKTE